MMTKELIQREFEGRYSSIQEIIEFVNKSDRTLSRQTIIWNVNDLIKQGKATRVGRGAYAFIEKAPFVLTLSEQAANVCAIIKENFKYLKVTVTDTTCLNQFMNLQPFTSIILIETKKVAVDAVISTLRNNQIESFAKKDFQYMEQYSRSAQLVLVSPERITNPTLKCKGNICYANLEKILVDLVCDERLYGQYQGTELENIFKNAIEKYAINYSQMLKYALARKRRADVEAILNTMENFRKVRSLL